MTLSLSDLDGCFEGVIPSIVATVAADGVPNISYLSHVLMVDADHIALSNQFFTKTKQNLADNPRATVLLVDGRDGRQFRVDAHLVETVETGSLFDRIASQLAASSAQVGLSGVMRLRSVDVFRVDDLVAVPSPSRIEPSLRHADPDLAAIAAATSAISSANSLTAMIDATLSAIERHLGYSHAMVLLGPIDNKLTTVGSLGYERSGIGSEVSLGDGVIGMAAARGQLVKVSDMSRIRRYGKAVGASGGDEDQLRTILLPSLDDAMSQIAVPMMANGTLQGVLFAEGRERLRFSARDEQALQIIASQAALSVALLEALSGEAAPAPRHEPLEQHGSVGFKVVHYTFDDSVFIDDAYVIKGVAGRLLIHMLATHLAERRIDFTNREIRLSHDLRLPDFKDNLETRLLLLQRRLDERSLPVRLVRTGRGRMRLVLDGQPSIKTI